MWPAEEAIITASPACMTAASASKAKFVADHAGLPPIGRQATTNQPVIAEQTSVADVAMKPVCHSGKGRKCISQCTDIAASLLFGARWASGARNRSRCAFVVVETGCTRAALSVSQKTRIFASPYPTPVSAFLTGFVGAAGGQSPPTSRRGSNADGTPGRTLARRRRDRRRRKAPTAVAAFRTSFTSACCSPPDCWWPWLPHWRASISGKHGSCISTWRPGGRPASRACRRASRQEDLGLADQTIRMLRSDILEMRARNDMGALQQRLARLAPDPEEILTVMYVGPDGTGHPVEPGVPAHADFGNRDFFRHHCASGDPRADTLYVERPRTDRKPEPGRLRSAARCGEQRASCSG